MQNGIWLGVALAAVLTAREASACKQVAPDWETALFVAGDPDATLAFDASSPLETGPMPSPTSVDWGEVKNRVTPTRFRAAQLADTIVVVLSKARLYHYRRGAIAAEYPVAYGYKTSKGKSVTPRGAFRIVHMTDLRGLKTDEFKKYGPCFLQLNVRPAGGRNIGIHGTNNPNSIGKAASSGCIRMRNEDARALYQLVAVGTPVVIQD